jgi:hypothetical protein
MLEKLIPCVKQGGILILSDPQYSKEITDNPDAHRKVIEAVKQYSEETIGHSEEPQGYIRQETVQDWMQSLGCELKLLDTLENAAVLSHLSEKGFEMSRSPHEFYVATFQKM